jgi:hypothetical protein
MAGKWAQAGRTHEQARPRPARSRISRVRANLVHNLINYIVWSTYLGTGAAVAASNHYFDHISFDHPSAVRPIISALAAVMLWPLIYLGADLPL